MYARIMEFVKENDVLYNMQFGFRKGHSTANALMLLTDQISNALYNGEYVTGVFLDFSKAFDTGTMEFYCENYIVTLLEVLLMIGWTVTYLIGLNMFYMRRSNLLRRQSRVEYHRFQYKDRCYFHYILMIWPPSLMYYFLFYLLMILIYFCLETK